MTKNGFFHLRNCPDSSKSLSLTFSGKFKTKCDFDLNILNFPNTSKTFVDFKGKNTDIS